MRVILKAIMILLAILSKFSSDAQVPNDNCNTAFNLDTIFSFSPSVNCFNAIPVDTMIQDSNFHAIVNFPYPAFPNPCQGYVNNINAPANDMWYRVMAVEGCDLELTFSNNDTLNIAVWFGDSCSYLVPVECFTLLPGTASYQIGGNLYSNTYFQVSGSGINSFSNFNICLSSTVPCVSIPIQGTPTPYICLLYDTIIIDASSAANNDGAIQINITAGNPPYTISWSNGTNGFFNSNLLPGYYVFTITDSLGCLTQDSILVGIATTTYQEFIPRCQFKFQNPISQSQLLQSLNDEFDRIVILDIIGKVIFDLDRKRINNIEHFSLDLGVYCVITFCHEKQSVHKLIIN